MRLRSGVGSTEVPVPLPPPELLPRQPAGCFSRCCDRDVALRGQKDVCEVADLSSQVLGAAGWASPFPASPKGQSSARKMQQKAAPWSLALPPRARPGPARSHLWMFVPLRGAFLLRGEALPSWESTRGNQARLKLLPCVCLQLCCCCVGARQAGHTCGQGSQGLARALAPSPQSPRWLLC